MSGFRVELVASAAKDYERLEAPVQRRVHKALQAISLDPLAGKPLQGPYAGLRSFRVGDYRIVYRTDAASQLVVVWAIGHRRDIYR